ncbi:MAG TPA: non-reducing end alpha-L-arabinofuranosidase family hydrolase, partial [Chthoniobacteraceae bacterium]|nr:non-reducing end alpha-L-arabinofuranosidase family hydrolase [Chthoniobacteraceae bacterium]
MTLRSWFVQLASAATFAFGTTTPGVTAEENLSAPFRWSCGAPIQGPAARANDRCFSVKDPTIVRHGDRWHLFTTIRSEKRTHQIEYSSFAEWREAASAPRHILTFNAGYFCAPQVFYFTPHRKWYLLHQASDPARPVALQPAFVTNENIENPEGWSRPTFLFEKHPGNVKAWIDFWVICDDDKAHL